ncbi:MAG: flagellar filament capping protein FliD [Sterolibacteriaceae bacterium]|uniref:Flagellar hook-associated protein 2 n=1 Tax=Candidatus Methylophosphatis roskildensis TaxID=2899263 RepID=A0A9D7E1W2_9PROT|nr:flagellar filament capping protein FliD [Candidatus Methylophosphatis roskildensis]MBK7235852.1 flagellar filament capping protein FliD [Sterolibacteriaceae bacterium]
MATISSAGVGSGLDIEGIISGLMAVERKPITQIQTQQSGLRSDISAYGRVQGALSALQSATQSLKTGSAFAAAKAKSSDETILTASAASGAPSGSVSVEVSQLAKAQQLTKGGFASSSAVVGTGTLTLEIGSYSGPTFTADPEKAAKSITIDSSNNTLAGIRDAINNAQAGVSAVIVNGSSGAQLFVTSNDQGTNNAIRIQQGGGNGGLAAIAFDNGATPGGLTEKTAPLDALLKVNGVDVTSSSNNVAGAVDGLTLNLLKTNVVSPATVSVAPDTETTQTNVGNFVKAYNDLNKILRDLTAYDPATKKAGELNGDPTIRSIQSQLRSSFSGVASNGGFGSLSEIGLGFGSDGALSLNAGKLAEALTNPTKSVSRIFATTNGVEGLASLIDTRVTTMLGSEGLVTGKVDGLNQRVASLDKRTTALETRMTSIEARYRAQFTLLDVTVASMNATSSYLKQQLASLSSSRG